MSDQLGAGPGLCGSKDCEEGNRNRAMLLNERREMLKDRRTNGYKRCDRVSSKAVAKEWVQDMSRVMIMLRSSLERKAREAVRIQMMAQYLMRKGYSIDVREAIQK
jgi:hypothetical protein